jgi:hypothetical protein
MSSFENGSYVETVSNMSEILGDALNIQGNGRALEYFN